MNFFLPHLLRKLRDARLTRRGATHHPHSVATGIHKAYPRMKSVVLPAPALEADLSETLLRRHSVASGIGEPDTEIRLQELGTLLGLALGKREGSRTRNYPSGGALYPIETYLVANAIESEVPGIFHYNPSGHVLERLWDLPPAFSMQELARRPDDLRISTLLVFTSVWERSSAKYGDLAFLHALLEAGHMSENILLVGTALGLHMRPYAGFNDALLARLLDIREEEEQAVHTIALCK
jgi:SagB-type dehydrogenase family enzyme